MYINDAGKKREQLLDEIITKIGKFDATLNPLLNEYRIILSRKCNSWSWLKGCSNNDRRAIVENTIARISVTLKINFKKIRTDLRAIPESNRLKRFDGWVSTMLRNAARNFLLQKYTCLIQPQAPILLKSLWQH